MSNVSLAVVKYGEVRVQGTDVRLEVMLLLFVPPADQLLEDLVQHVQRLVGQVGSQVWKVCIEEAVAVVSETSERLFPGHAGRPLTRQTAAVNRLAAGCDIFGLHGQRVWFEALQFRHTVGTSLINNGVPQHLVQRFLGHETRK